jgi:hypothetical protein
MKEEAVIGPVHTRFPETEEQLEGSADPPPVICVHVPGDPLVVQRYRLLPAVASVAK